jgi:site-specific DNA recombinase
MGPQHGNCNSHGDHASQKPTALRQPDEINKKRRKQKLRCAIYTRVSDERNLSPRFNSIDAQYEACSDYILSQAHEDWVELAERYDDDGFSGGTIERPALRRLCRDLRLGKIDIIVLYKIDRLTRSLRDFVKLLELLDRYQVSFVSVTQPLNTATSMGRMLLNVLLSFAEYERELASERIYDKIAASKRKGVWAGGPIALGYQTHNGKVIINTGEARQVRMVFNKYLELGTLSLLLEYLAGHGIVTRQRVLKNGTVRRASPFTHAELGGMLRNRTYIGQVVFEGEVLKGPQPPIIDRMTFDEVQRQLDRQRIGRNRAQIVDAVGTAKDASGQVLALRFV